MVLRIAQVANAPLSDDPRNHGRTEAVALRPLAVALGLAGAPK